MSAEHGSPADELPPILVVDDDPTQRLMFRQALERDGHAVIAAEDAERAQRLFIEHRPVLALVDAMMPGMDGFELSQRLHAMEGGEELTVLMATSLSDDADIEHAFRSGAADFISKPINWTVLRGRINHLLQTKLAERQVRQTEEQLRQAQKMTAIGNLSSGIAHEFNNILASIMGYTELLQEFIAHTDDPKAMRYADEVYRSARRASDLVQQMQLFSQTKPGQLQPLQIKPLIKEHLKILRSSLPSTINLQLTLADDLPPIMADPALFQQILTNLLLNARDAINGKGVIIIALRRSDVVGQPCSSCQLPFEGDYLQLQISDSGSGIPPEVQKKMFDPYYTTKPVGRGTGMGLSVVHGIVHDMGGHIVVESSHDRGTSITLFFPTLANLQEEKSTMINNPQNDHQGPSGRRILLIDDETSITGYLTELLELHDYQVTPSNDAQAALNLFLEDPDGFDLVVTDMTLPGLTGIELATAMRQLRPELPVILCSGYIDDETRQQIETTGIRAAFNKPVDSRTLLESIETLLQNG